jgi:tetratricopeptide (TPR) repeat protein
VSRLVLALALLLASLAPAAAAPPADGEVARLAAALAEHPDDAALARALARAQLERGDVDAALATLRGFAARHPEQQPQLAQMLGRALYEKGELAPARAALEQALVHREDAALSHFYLGLVLLKSGDAAGAARALSRAAQLDPTLAGGIRRAGGAGAPAPAAGRFAVRLGSGFEYDSNPSLAGDESLSSLLDEGSDVRWVYDAALGARLLRTENGLVTASYRFEESRHDEQDALDLQTHSVGLAGLLALGSRAFARFDAGAALQRLDHEGYVDAWSAGPALGFSFERLGLVQLRAFGGERAFDDAAPLPSLERDGWHWGAALEHRLPVTLWAPGLLTSSVQYARTRTDGDTDLFGFGPAFDSRFIGAETGLAIPLAFGVRLESRLLAGYERFDEDNVIEFLDSGASGERRRDTVLDATLSLVRPLGDWLELELRLRESLRLSNVGAYDSDRFLVGTYLRFQIAR